MRLLLITGVMLLASCGAAIDLTQEPGWTGPVPATMQEFALAAAAEKHGRERANKKLELAAKKLR